MPVLTGRSGQLFVNGARAAKCIGWSLDESRPMLDNTPVDVWDQTVVPGRRSGVGSAKLLYDPEDAGAAELFDSILLNGISELPITMFLDQATGEGYPVAVHVSSASHAVSRGAAQSRDISFRLSDVGIELEIIGSEKAAIGVTQLYTGAVYGIDGAWTYLWTSSGPVIANPTSQTTNITFDTLGTFTLTLTATLGLTVLTDTHVVEVIDIPLMWISRTTGPQAVGAGARQTACCLDKVNQVVYHTGFNSPDITLGSPRNLISKFDYAGNRLITKALGGLTTDEPVLFIQVLADGTIFVATAAVGGPPRWMRLSADLSTIIYQFRATAGMTWGAATYDVATNRVYACKSATGVPYVAYIDAATGSIVKVNITSVPAIGFGTSNSLNAPPLITQSGKVLLVFPGPGNPGSNAFFVIEFNKDLLNGGLYNPTQTVEHQFSTAVIPTNVGSMILVESDNHIIMVSSASDAMRAFLLNKSDYSHVDNRRFGTQAGGLFAGPKIHCAYFYAGEVAVVSDRFFNQGTAIMKFAADLSAGISYVEHGGSTSSGSLLNNGGFTPQGSLASGTGGTSSSAGFDEELGLIALNYSTDKFLTAACFYRVNYGAFYSLQYDNSPNRWMAVQPKSLVNFMASAVAISFTLSRAYTGALTPPTIGASTASISDELQIVHQEYILA